MNNFTFFTEFTLLGLSADPHIQALLFVLFLGTYLLTLVGNTAMILIMKADSRLHTPMYFFLRHLSFLDLSFSSVTVPKMLQNFLSQKKSISVWGCITQSFFFTLSGGTEACLLSAMAYDRYAAVCHPLLYTVVMNRPLCTAMVCAAGLVGLLNSLVNHLFIHRLHFCGPNTVSHFFCELPSLFPLSCADPTANEFLLSGSSAFLGLLTLPLILLSYSRIISAVLNIDSSEDQGKASPPALPTSLWCSCSMGRLCSGTSAPPQAQCWSEWSPFSTVSSHPCWTPLSTASRTRRWRLLCKGCWGSECDPQRRDSLCGFSQRAGKRDIWKHLESKKRYQRSIYKKSYIVVLKVSSTYQQNQNAHRLQAS